MQMMFRLPPRLPHQPSATIYGLKQMHAISHEYANEFNIRFNPAKFQLVRFNSYAHISLVLEGIESTTTGILLGREISINWQRAFC